MAVIPARVRKPRDKAKAEAGVLLVERWILAALRNRMFFSLRELNDAISQLLERLNTRPFKKLPGSRQEAFLTLDKPALSALPAEPYEFAQWKPVRVHIDYHVELERHYYSVPYVLVGKQLMLRYTATTVECLYRGERVASHLRSHARRRHTTVDEHMPEHHRLAGHKWSPQRLQRWAESIGTATGALIEQVLRARRHPQQSYRTCLGILGLAKSYGDQRLEAACRRALTLGSHSVRSVESILKHRLDEHDVAQQHELDLPSEHENLRGAEYFH
jgi:transposase